MEKLRVFHVLVARGKHDREAAHEDYYVAAMSMPEAVAIVDRARSHYFDNAPVEIVKVEMLTGVWLVDKEQR